MIGTRTLKSPSAKSRFRNETFCVIGLLLSLSLPGCGSVSTDVSDQSEHHVPKHKPRTFAAAIEQVHSRHKRISIEFQTADVAQLERELSEQLDIIGWLTELAADSPMKKPEWDRVNLSSKELLVIYQRIARTAKDHPRGEWPVDASRVEDLVASLATLVPFADAKL
jgi:hypothetical protein